ncbi:hypothetical protein FKW77_009617 [Venturia effusa]|uniref:Glycosyl hydrolase family 13 catalytic domain-containing protein n=1 Tax=Venturia effusa TaxID=50376 RepID=A0A517L9Z4_9PEZI|nr:hypothetical protein FKW77_009617 [Venturia effusa]
MAIEHSSDEDSLPVHDIKSLQDEVVNTVLLHEGKKFTASPIAWEDQILYFLLPDRFSNNAETDYVDNDGTKVSTGTTVPFQSSDEGNALLPDPKPWLDAGARFCGGSLKGVTTKLGYLKRMGVTALWIGPIFKQVAALETYHGYGVQNFLNVDPRFGTPEDLVDLVKQAHAMHVYIILDIILNHSGNVFEYAKPNVSPIYAHGQKYPVKGFYDENREPVLPFERVDLDKHPTAFPDGAIWPAELQEGKTIFTAEGQIRDWDADPEYLDGDFFNLPDVAIGEDDVSAFSPTPALLALVEIYKFWIAYADLDAFRLDTVKHMGHGPTRYFCNAIHEFTAALGKENFMIIGEITGSNAFETVEATGLNAALGIGGIQQSLWQMPKGESNPQDYFDLFRNAAYLKKGSHSWLRNKIVTMIDDHDQVWRGNLKARFCADNLGPPLLFAALALNLTTLGIPCIYYGTEQSFDGAGSDGSPGHAADQYIRESMFGGAFGPFRSRDRHCFIESSPVYRQIADLAAIRGEEMALRRGRQYLREISGDGRTFGYPVRLGQERMTSIIAWSRIFDGEEIVCAINTDVEGERSVWVTVDSVIHGDGSRLTQIFPRDGGEVLQVVMMEGRATIPLRVPAAGFVMFK